MTSKQQYKILFLLFSIIFYLHISIITANQASITNNENSILSTDLEIEDTEALYSCDETSDCLNLGLKESVCRDKVCVDGNLFPLSRREIIGSIGALFAGALAAGSGLGGGGLLVPLYILTMGLSSHESIPLSKATIFGSSIASFIVNIRKKHPFDATRPLIDYETMLLMEPMTLAGTIIGVNLNAIFPEWLITICIVWLLTKTSLRTFTKGQKIWKEETEEEKKKVSNIIAYWKLLPYESKLKNFQLIAYTYLKWKSYKRKETPVIIHIKRQQESEHSYATTAEGSSEEDGSDNEQVSLMNTSVKKIQSTELKTLTMEDLRRMRRTIPLVDIGVLFLTWLGLVAFSMAKGGHGSPSIIGLECGSPGYWLLMAASLPFFVAVSLYFGAKSAKFHELLQSYGYEYLKGDMVWTKSAVIKYPALCTAAGAAAGLLGIGGGMVKGPLLLEMGLIPQVSSATSSSMILFTSSATTVQFIILGTLSIEHALWSAGVGFVAGLIGQFGLSYLIKKYRKTAFVIFLIAIVVGSSGIIMGALGSHHIYKEGFGGFRPLCPRT